MGGRRDHYETYFAAEDVIDVCGRIWWSYMVVVYVVVYGANMFRIGVADGKMKIKMKYIADDADEDEDKYEE